MEWFVFAIMFLAFLLITWVANASLTTRYRAEIRQLDQKVDFLYRKFELDYAKEQAAMLPGRVRDLAASGNKIEAIKAYREATGADLLTSKLAVEAMGANNMPPQMPVQSNPPAYGRYVGPHISLSPEVMRLVETDKKLQAIKLLREQTRVGLKEAKDAVEVYEREISLK